MRLEIVFMNKVLKEKFQLEFPMIASTALLFEYIASAEGLGEWFADKVIEKGDEFTFFWGNEEERAYLLRFKTEQSIRFRWEEDEDTKYFFEMGIQVDEITNDVALIITDFAEPDELDEEKQYWENLIEDLKDVIGS